MGFIFRKRSKIATQAFSFCCLPAHPRIIIHHGRQRKGHRSIQQSDTRNGKLGLASRSAKHFINAYFSQIVLYVFSHSKNRKMEFTIPQQRVRKSTLCQILCGQSLGVSQLDSNVFKLGIAKDEGNGRGFVWNHLHFVKPRRPLTGDPKVITSGFAIVFLPAWLSLVSF